MENETSDTHWDICQSEVGECMWAHSKDGITLGGGDIVGEVAGGASSMDVDRIGEIDDMAS